MMTDQTKSISEQIKTLIQLQAIDSQIYQLNDEKRQLPLWFENLKNEFKTKELGLKNAEENYKKLLITHKEKEVDLQAKEDSIKKYQIQLYQVKTNKEYSSLKNEIEGIRADNSLLEEEIIKLLDEIDKAKAEVDKEKVRLHEEEEKLKAEENRFKESIKAIEEKLKLLDNERRVLSPNIEKNILSKYERVLKNKNGLALVSVIDDACGGCHLNLPPQVINEITMRTKIIICESCARILYISDQQESQQNG